MKAKTRYQQNLEALIRRFCEAGFTATHYPRLRMVAINGFPRMPEAPAISYMLRALEQREAWNPAGHVAGELREALRRIGEAK